jgi:hypothetical protein
MPDSKTQNGAVIPAPQKKTMSWQRYYARQLTEWPFDIKSHRDPDEWRDPKEFPDAAPKNYIFLAKAVLFCGRAFFSDFERDGIVFPAHFNDVVSQMRQCAAEGRIIIVYQHGRVMRNVEAYRWQPNPYGHDTWRILFEMCHIEHEAMFQGARRPLPCPMFVEEQSLKTFVQSINKPEELEDGPFLDLDAVATVNPQPKPSFADAPCGLYLTGKYHSENDYTAPNVE